MPLDFDCYYAEDASLLTSDTPLVAGKENITKAWSELFRVPGASVTWESQRVEVARSGDLAFSQGSFEISIHDSDGKLVTDHGKYVAVWKKQPNGRWKAVADIGNPDHPSNMTRALAEQR
jgi:ketosteroid isomerase-like protein